MCCRALPDFSDTLLLNRIKDIESGKATSGFTGKIKGDYLVGARERQLNSCTGAEYLCGPINCIKILKEASHMVAIALDGTGNYSGSSKHICQPSTRDGCRWPHKIGLHLQVPFPCRSTRSDEREHILGTTR